MSEKMSEAVMDIATTNMLHSSEHRVPVKPSRSSITPHRCRSLRARLALANRSQAEPRVCRSRYSEEEEEDADDRLSGRKRYTDLDVIPSLTKHKLFKASGDVALGETVPHPKYRPSLECNGRSTFEMEHSLAAQAGGRLSQETRRSEPLVAGPISLLRGIRENQRKYGDYDACEMFTELEPTRPMRSASQALRNEKQSLVQGTFEVTESSGSKMGSSIESLDLSSFSGRIRSWNTCVQSVAAHADQDDELRSTTSSCYEGITCAGYPSSASTSCTVPTSDNL